MISATAATLSSANHSSLHLRFKEDRLLPHDKKASWPGKAPPSLDLDTQVPLTTALLLEGSITPRTVTGLTTM